MVLKVLLLLALTGGTVAKILRDATVQVKSLEEDVNDIARCGEGMYFSKTSGECEFCSECKEFMYIRRECSSIENTQCGWCGSRQIVRNADFEKKCKSFSMFQQFRQKLIHEFEAKQSDDYEEDAENDGAYQKIVVSLTGREEFSDEDKEDFILADEEDFMKRPVYSSKSITYPESEELTSEEIDVEIKAKEVDETEIAESAETKDEETQTNEEDDEKEKPDPSFNNEDELASIQNAAVKTALATVEEIKNNMLEDMIRRQMEQGDYEVHEDEQHYGQVIEVRPPKDFRVASEEIEQLQEAEETQDQAEEVQLLPIRIVVTGDINDFKNGPLPKNFAGSESSEESREDSEADSSSEEDVADTAAQEFEELRTRTSRRMIRIALMSISFVVMCWVFLSYREKRRRRVFIIPPLDQFTPEQNHMINRCTCTVDGKEAHCYENKLAYV